MIQLDKSQELKLNLLHDFAKFMMCISKDNNNFAKHKSDLVKSIEANMIHFQIKANRTKNDVRDIYNAYDICLMYVYGSLGAIECLQHLHTFILKFKS